MAATYKIIGQVLVLMTSFLAIQAFPSPNQNYTCTVGGQDHQVGDAIGDPCDGCVCTQYGTMCQLRFCQPAMCVDKVKLPGECCYTCPSGPNCEYTGSKGRSIIPADGCRYSDSLLCYCYESRIAGHQMRPYCLPPFLGDLAVPCNVTSLGME